MNDHYSNVISYVRLILCMNNMIIDPPWTHPSIVQRCMIVVTVIQKTTACMGSFSVIISHACMLTDPGLPIIIIIKSCIQCGFSN